MNGFQYKHGDRPLEGFTIQRTVGRGGFGEVYFAISDSGREVALKAIQGYEQIELRGVSQCMNLKSPHLVTIFDVKHNADDKPFVIMEYVNGPSLKDLLEQSPSGLGVQKTAFFLREIAKGLSYLHDRGIVHRDLKPGNIFYEDGYVKIGDYGLSKAMSASRYSGQTITVGTVHYMAPEIGQGKYDCGVDIYALGCCLYEMLTGNVPFFGASHGEILMKHLMSEPDLAGIEEPFAAAIKKSMVKDPNERCKSVQEMVEIVFGSENVRNSVSCFSPDSLSMVAAKVAEKVAVGGPGSSADAGRFMTPPPVPPLPGVDDPWANFANRMSRLGENVGERVRTRLRFTGQDTLNAPDPTQPEILDEHTETIADPHRDPLRGRQRRFLALMTVATTGLTAGYLGTGNISTIDGAWFFASLITLGGVSGIILAYHLMRRHILLEEGFLPRLVCGGMGIAGGALGLFLTFIIMNGPGHFHSQATPSALFVLTISTFLINWRGRVSPGRKERVTLGMAFSAGLCGWIISMFMHAPSLMVAAMLAGTSMAVQVGVPFDPQALRRKKRKHRNDQWWNVGSTGEPRNEPHPAPANRRADAQNVAPPGSPARSRTNAPAQKPYMGQRERLYVMPAWARVVSLVLFALLLGTGILMLIAAGMAHRDSEAVPFMVFGFGSLAFAIFCLVRSLRTTYRSLWSALFKPLLMMLCCLCAFTSLAIMGTENHLYDDEMLIGLAFVIFPAIFFIMIAFIGDRHVTTAVAATGLNKVPPRYRPSYPVSNSKRLYALPMTLPGLIPFCPIAGIHRFYVGKIGTGILWLLTGGLLGVGTIIDIILISVGRFRDSEGKWVVSWQGELPAVFPMASAAGTAPAVVPIGAAAAVNETPMYEAVTAPYPYVAPPTLEPSQEKTPRISNSWTPPERPRIMRKTNWILNKLGMLIVGPAFLLGIASVIVPHLLAVGIPDPRWTKDLNDFFKGGDWPEILIRLGLIAATLVMLFGLALLVMARRYAGAAHTGRAVLGAISLGTCINLLNEALLAVSWSEIPFNASTAGPAIRIILDSIHTPQLAGAGVLFLLGMSLLSWPERRIDSSSIDHVREGAL